MTIIRKWTAQAAGYGSITFECPYYDELTSSHPGGCLTRDLECHALWQYYGMAMLAYERAKKNLVADDELSLVFTTATARQLFLSIANNHGVSPSKMVNFWPVVQRQRIALGGGDDLPSEFQFTYWGN